MGIENPISGDRILCRLDQLIDQRSKENPEAIAIKHGNRTLSFKAVNDTATRLSLYFTEQHIQHQDIVGVILERSPEMVIILLALIKAGATYLPIDCALPANRINYMLGDSGAKFLITSKKLAGDSQPGMQTIFIEDALKKSSSQNIKNYKVKTGRDDLAYVLYTSGSTGMPKGVQVKHSGLLNLLLSIQQTPGITSADVVLATTTISFDIAALELFLPLIAGAKLVIADAETVRDGRLLREIAITEGITIMQGTPIMWINMLESGWKDPLPIKIFCGGEAMTREMARDLVAKCNSLWNMYGPTETTIYSTIKHVTADDKLITIGKPIRNTQIYILNEHRHLLADEEIGEIYIGGTGVARGYINKPELTAERFIDDPFSLEGQIYKTGDLGRVLDNGEIECLGRIDHQVKIRGYRIETEEVEYQLKQLEGVKETLVIPFKDFREHMHLVAYIVVNDGETESQAAWKAGLKAVLPEYMVPDIFRVIPAIPRLSNGKVDRNSLPDPIMRENVSARFEPPATDTERSLVEICLANIALEEIGVTDDFFELGLDSLAAVQIMVQIEDQFSMRLPLSTLIQYPTIRQLAMFMDNEDKYSSRYKSLIPIQPNGDKIPLYIVHGIGLNILNLYAMVSSLDKDQPVYGLQPLGLDGTVEPLDNMEAIAKNYISEIIAHDPEGPYAISGYSFGGYIAYEMARQLKAMGKEVVMLGMFDTNVQNFHKQHSNAEKLKIKINRQFSKLAFRTKTFLTHPLMTVDYLKTFYTQKTAEVLSRAGLTGEYNPEKLPPFMLDIISKLQIAFENYELEPLDVKIELFKAKIRIYHIDDPELLGWGKYALKGVNVYNVPGDHKLMFSSPNDKVLAQKVQILLNQVNSRNATEKITLV